MEILQLTPGAGAMFCGNCLRDNALVAALRAMGHHVLMVPLYLPLTLDETDQSAGIPVFFNGINVYLEQKSPWFRRGPAWLHRVFAATWLLKWAAKQAGNTTAQSLGPLTLSMLRGEEGNQARELEELITWLKTQQRPDVIFLSNVMLLGMARRLKRELNRPIVCMLQGEDYFLNNLPEPYRSDCWRTLSERSKDADTFVAPSRYFGALMQERLGLSPDRVRVVYNGISLDGYESKTTHEVSAAGASPDTRKEAPVLGYFARMCPEKGLDTLVDAFVILRKSGRVPGLQLRIGGSLGASDEAFVRTQRKKLETAGLAADASFHPNVDRATKVSLLESFTVFSVPARYGEAFGLYVIEALAAGVPVVQPRTAAFPELLELTAGGVLHKPDDPQDLAQAIEGLLRNPERARTLGETGRRAVIEKLSAQAMAQNLVETLQPVEPCTT